MEKCLGIEGTTATRARVPHPDEGVGHAEERILVILDGILRKFVAKEAVSKQLQHAKEKEPKWHTVCSGPPL